ncbi:MAG: SCP2 sterol-binding domain-containing protein [Gammaproteobacteria bacterium]|nr:SCP2 sterol-binding domain-containing protein [Gammaproteobacteria bacterium]
MSDPLDRVLQPVAGLLNRTIAESTPAREAARQLAGKVIAIRVRDTSLAMFFHVNDETLILTGSGPEEPDLVVTGSLLSLLALMRADAIDTIRGGKVDLAGDAEVARLFQQLLRFARPDFEEELSSVVGDIAAHRIGELARGVTRWAGDARRTMGINITEYLQEESRDVPSRYEVERFGDDVSRLRDDVERAAARLNRLDDGR